MLLPLLMTTIAGLSTGLGGLIAALFRPTPRLMAFCGGFAGAVMLTVSLADLAPALLDFYGALLSPFGCGAAAAALLLGGMLAAWLLACALPDEDTLADRFGSRTQGSAASNVRFLLTTTLAGAPFEGGEKGFPTVKDTTTAHAYKPNRSPPRGQIPSTGWAYFDSLSICSPGPASLRDLPIGFRKGYWDRNR